MCKKANSLLILEIGASEAKRVDVTCSDSLKHEHLLSIEAHIPSRTHEVDAFLRVRIIKMSAIALSSVAAVSGDRTALRARSANKASSKAKARRGPVRTDAFFGRKDPGGGVEVVYEESKSEAYARIKKQRAKTKAKFEAQEKGGASLFFFNALSAVNFEEDIKEDRGLLAAAKRMGKGDKMSREQYGALQRKVGGTKGGFFGENIFAKGEYLDRGYVEKAEEQPVPVLGMGFLYGVLVAVLGATGYVVYAVGQAGAI